VTDDSGTKNPYSPYRWLAVLLRSVHISAMAVVLGGVFLDAKHETIGFAVWATLLSGSLMLLMDIAKSHRILLQGSGLAVLLKLALLATGFFFLPEQRFALYLAATIVASAGSHMPGQFRHCDILLWRSRANKR
jgi:hypothetical protein